MPWDLRDGRWIEEAVPERAKVRDRGVAFTLAGGGEEQDAEVEEHAGGGKGAKRDLVWRENRGRLFEHLDDGEDGPASETLRIDARVLPAAGGWEPEDPEGIPR